MTAPLVLVETRARVALVRLNRPEKLNALTDALLAELITALSRLDADPAIAVTVLTGSERAFAAGADVATMAGLTAAEAFSTGAVTRHFDSLARLRKPLVAAVAGYALGGGLELALACDIVIAADTALFGQPEVKLGIPPGGGATQRLPRLIGKSAAMEMCLTGATISAAEALRLGLVSRLVPAEALLPETLALAEKIAAHSLPALMLIKACVNRAFETPLPAGLALERQAFFTAMGFADRAEGMAAFLEKRPPRFKDS
jgi:enoyl-CoA hydratase